MKFYTYMLLACFLETVGDVMLKRGYITKGVVVYGAGSYIIGAWLWFTALKYADLSRALPIFSVVSVLAGVACGLFFFKESLTWTQWMGIASGCLGLLLI